MFKVLLAIVLIAAYRKAGIDPRTVGYIEAHGTGTALGDPIEINGLKTAFSELAQIIGEGPMPQVSCGIGSVKSNIGHLELASGVAGVIKVLLQMHHKKLVKSLHCEQINPYIQLEGCPFYIVQENRAWEAPQDHAGNLWPRRAGVSSFGFGGANAHVVLEEYVPEPQEKLPGSLTQSREPDRGKPYPPLLIVLSAKNEERLNAQVRQLLAWVVVETAPWACPTSTLAWASVGTAPWACPTSTLAWASVGTAPWACPTSTEEPQDQQRDRSEAQFLQDLAYTLQVGREAMEERLALLVSSRAQLEESLRSYLQEPQGTGDWYRGQAKQYKAMLALLGADEELQEISGKWLQHGKYEKLLQGWVKGFTIDWELLYGEQRPRRISLPTYPFAQERYWLPTTPILQYPLTDRSNEEMPKPLPATPDASDSNRTIPNRSSGFAIGTWTGTSGQEQATTHTSPYGPCLPNSQTNPTIGAEPRTCLQKASGAAITVSLRPLADHPAHSGNGVKQSQLEEELVRSLAQCLYMEEGAIDVEKPFVEMGLDSVVGVEWIQSLNKQYVCNLKASSVYDYPTIRQLASFLQKGVLKHQHTHVQGTGDCKGGWGQPHPARGQAPRLHHEISHLQACLQAVA